MEFTQEKYEYSSEKLSNVHPLWLVMKSMWKETSLEVRGRTLKMHEWWWWWSIVIGEHKRIFLSFMHSTYSMGRTIHHDYWKLEEARLLFFSWMKATELLLLLRLWWWQTCHFPFLFFFWLPRFLPSIIHHIPWNILTFVDTHNSPCGV